MGSKKSNRRQFLQNSAALVGLASMGVRAAKGDEEVTPDVIHIPKSGRPVGSSSPYEKLRRETSGHMTETPLQDLDGIITPSNLHFVVDHEQNLLMNIDPQKHRLAIYGMVERPTSLTMADIKRLPSVSRIHFLECNSNTKYRYVKDAKTVQQSHGLTSCSEWTGVLLSVLLKEVGVQKGAWGIIASAADPSRHAVSIPMEKAMDDALVAYGQNGEALQLDQGYPLRLVLPGWAGRKNTKYLDSIKVVDQPYFTSHDPSGELDHDSAGVLAAMIGSDRVLEYHFNVFPKSVITFPSGGQKLPGPGSYEIRGLAWSGAGSIRRVEVSLDGGRTWKDAKLQGPVLPKAHTRFRFPWTWSGQEVELQSRCTDDQGDRQPSATELSKNWGTDPSKACAQSMGEEYCKQVPRRADHSYIMPWRVARDGKVYSAFILTPEMLKLESRPLVLQGDDTPNLCGG